MARDKNPAADSPKPLIKSAADLGGAPAEPNIQDELATTAVDENADVVEMLTTLLQEDPQLAAKIADTIEQHYIGGVNMPDTSTPMPNVGGTPTGPAVPPMPVGGASPNKGVDSARVATAPAQSVPDGLVDRLSRVEQTQASMALDRELADARREYEDLKNQMPILPELNDNELLQIALDNDGIPLKQALAIWAMQKMREGDGTIADRLMAVTMNKSKARGLPAVEGKGGSIPSGEASPPQNMKDARSLAKDRLRALFSSNPGQ